MLTLKFTIKGQLYSVWNNTGNADSRRRMHNTVNLNIFARVYFRETSQIANFRENETLAK